MPALDTLLRTWLPCNHDTAFHSPQIPGAHLATARGTIRPTNQDVSLLMVSTTRSEPCVLAILADGMGGLPRGQEAATLAASTLAIEFLSSSALTQEWLVTAIHRVNERVYRDLQGKSGTTLVGFVGTRNIKLGFSVGDSHLLSFAEGQLTRINELDTIGEAVYRLTGLPYSSDLPTTRSDLLTQHIGASTPPIVHTYDLSSLTGPLVLLSDGALVLDLPSMSRMFRHTLNSNSLTKNIMTLSRLMGTSDNATVLFCEDLTALLKHTFPRDTDIFATSHSQTLIFPSDVFSSRAQKPDPEQFRKQKTIKPRRALAKQRTPSDLDSRPLIQVVEVVPPPQQELLPDISTNEQGVLTKDDSSMITPVDDNEAPRT